MNSRNNQSGFTLIELLVVVGIIGVLAVVAIPQYAGYRVYAFNSLARSDLRNVISAEEAYYADNEVYVDCTLDCGTVLPGMNVSHNVQLTVEATPTGFLARSTHSKGDHIYQYDTVLGFSEAAGGGPGGL